MLLLFVQSQSAQAACIIGRIVGEPGVFLSGTHTTVVALVWSTALGTGVIVIAVRRRRI